MSMALAVAHIMLRAEWISASDGCGLFLISCAARLRSAAVSLAARMSLRMYEVEVLMKWLPWRLS
ncbi:hypothetical protein PI125_g27253 [Phytophthora idaei]|nr:hypothetical protein PI125_g27253 [Phytophthora idaei]